MSAFAAAFVLLLWLPGHLAFRLSGSPKAPQRRWPAAERLFAEVLLSGLMILWLAVSLGLLGVLTRAALIVCCSLITLALLAVVLRKRDTLGTSPAYRPGASAVIAVALIVVGTWLYAPQFEQLIGGRDPTTYMVSGIHMGRTGSWIAHDEIVTTLRGTEVRHDLLGTTGPGRFGDWGPRFLGWYLMDPDTGRVVPQGLPLYPAAIALGYMLADVQGALRSTTVLAIAAVLALFFLGWRLLTPAVGLTAAVLLLVSPAQVWFSRFANAETLTQLLLVTGLYGLVVHRRHGGWAYGLLAAMAFGLSLQAHIWMVWIAFPLLGILVFDLLQARVDRQAMLSFWAPLVVLGVQALAVYLAVTTAYLWGVYAVLKWSMWAIIPAIPALAAILAGVWYWGRQRSSTADAPTAPQDGVGWARTAAAIAIALAAAYGYLLRPLVSTAWSAESVQRLALATTLAVLAFAVAGIVMLLLDRRRGLATLCFLAVALGIIVPVLWHPSIQRKLMWSLRRYQTFLPLVFLFAAVPLWMDHASWSKRAADWRHRFSGMALIMVTLVLIAMVGAQGLSYRGFKEPGESVALIDSVTATLEDDALLVFEARSGWGVLDLAAPLAYWKGFDVVWLRFKDRRSNSEVLRDLVRVQAQRGRAVYFFTQGFNYYMPEPRMVPHGRWWFLRQQLDETLGELPTTVRSSRIPFSIYKLEASGTAEPLDGLLDVGYWDDNYVGEALALEVIGNLTARWTKGTAFFWLPGMPAGTREIIVHADTVADSESLGRTLRARLDGIDLGEIPITAGWPDYVFEVPSDWQPTAGQAPMLELATEPIQPDAMNGEGDTRYLGVLVNAILWR